MGMISGGRPQLIRGSGALEVSDSSLVTAFNELLIELKRIRYGLQIQTDQLLNINEVED